ncbi:acyl-[acyl-carrier-protein]--UDP-N-acetylglucosamine O-acyltransferase [bacterium]|nr:MAG: acyl-[acyl-carrier-protein]--UDP-N-acetylglucosamine O-acyltransferase [bacterium]
MSVRIHRTAIVSPRAKIGEDVVIGEYAVIRDGVCIGDGVEVGSHALIEGRTTIGSGTKIFHGAAIGMPPQDLKYRGEDTELIVGRNNVIREFASLHRGTAKGKGKTIIGDGNFIMAYVHIAHDCVLGNNIIISNATNLGGHVEIGDTAVIGGMVAVHQFVHIGRGAMIGAASLVLQDVLPFALASGNPAKIYDINRVGMRRKDFPRSTIDAIHKAVFIATRKGLSIDNAMKRIEGEFFKIPEIEEILQFIKNRSRRGIMRGDRVVV